MKKKSVTVLLCVILVSTILPASAFASTEKSYDSKEKKSVEQLKEKESGCEAQTLGDSSNEKNAEVKKNAGSGVIKSKGYEADVNGDYIRINQRDNFIVYRGQKVWTNFTMWDTYEDYSTIPSIEVYDSNIDHNYYSWNLSDQYIVPYEGLGQDYSGYVPVKLKKGSYVLAISAMPCDIFGFYPRDWYVSFDVPIAFVNFKVVDLPKPTGLSVSRGKKKCVIKYKKPAAASKCVIYRSTKKSKGYKKVATISGKKYTDKKVKRGKRYYYKVRALRGNGNSGIAYSSYTAPKRSGKVK